MKKLVKSKPTETQQSSITFFEWYQKWKTLYKINVKESTEKEYEVAMKHLAKFQNVDISKITSIELLELFNAIPGERARQKTYEFARMVFEKAFLNEIIKKNPMMIIDKPKHLKVNGNALSNEDEQKIEKMFIEDKADSFLIGLYQGLRKGEILALKIDDVNFEEKTLTIDESLNFKNQLDTTKNETSKRIMPLFDKTAEVLKKYKNISGRLFPFANQTFDRMFDKYSECFKTRYTIHSLRHTFITRCQECGVPLHIIQKWVGHKKGSLVTLNVYTHTRDSAELENINILNEKLNSN